MGRLAVSAPGSLYGEWVGGAWGMVQLAYPGSVPQGWGWWGGGDGGGGCLYNLGPRGLSPRGGGVGLGVGGEGGGKKSQIFKI